VSTDPLNCGDCGHTCMEGLNIYDCCDGICTDTSSDPNNCGECGAICRPPGECNLYSCMCPTGQAYCDGDCVDIQTDPHHCGGCDNDCGEDIPCEAGACICPDGLAYCDGSCQPMDDCVTSVFGEGTGTATITPGDDVCPGAEMYDGVASWYEFGGALPHCSFPPDLFPPYYAAINTADYAASATCGACARIFYAGQQLDVVIIDECPTCGT
jgi:hypothetical protein